MSQSTYTHVDELLRCQQLGWLGTLQPWLHRLPVPGSVPLGLSIWHEGTPINWTVCSCRNYSQAQGFGLMRPLARWTLHFWFLKFCWYRQMAGVNMRSYNSFRLGKKTGKHPSIADRDGWNGQLKW